eukprot:g10005.t1
MDYAVNSAIVAPKIAGYSEQEDLIFVCTRTNTILLMNLAGQVLKSFCSGKRDKASGGLEQTLKVAEKEVIGLAHHPSRNELSYVM